MAENSQPAAAGGRITTMDQGPPGVPLSPARLDPFLDRPPSRRPRATGAHAEGGAAILFDPEAGAERVQDPDSPRLLYTPAEWAVLAAARQREAEEAAAAGVLTQTERIRLAAARQAARHGAEGG